MFVFFFSSRRRHTRYIGDWSSDVCSSDLGAQRRHRLARQQTGLAALNRADEKQRSRWERSEERRVGEKTDRKRSCREGEKRTESEKAGKNSNEIRRETYEGDDNERDNVGN